jgi:hypothetical protein
MNNYCLITVLEHDFGLIETKTILCPANDYNKAEKHVIEMLKREKTKEVHITHFYANGEVKEINIYYFKDILYKDNSLYIVL